MVASRQSSEGNDFLTSPHLIKRCLRIDGAQHRQHVPQRVEARILVHGGDLVPIRREHPCWRRVRRDDCAQTGMESRF